MRASTTTYIGVFHDTARTRDFQAGATVVVKRQPSDTNSFFDHKHVPATVLDDASRCCQVVDNELSDPPATYYGRRVGRLQDVAAVGILRVDWSKEQSSSKSA